MRPDRIAPYVVLGLCAAGVVALLLAAALHRSDNAFSLAVSPQQALPVRPGYPVCQRSIEVENPFDRLKFPLGTYKRPGPRVDVVVRRGGAAIGHAVLLAGY